MKELNHILTAIAREHLGISTLQTRRSDRLDFHDLAVWRIRAALAAAFDAGSAIRNVPPEPACDQPTRFDDYEIQPCRRYLDPNEAEMSFVELCEPFDADFWTLYGHIPGEGAQAIGDFDTREHAEEVFARITGRGYAE